MGQSDFAVATFDRGELDQLEQDLALTASEGETAGWSTINQACDCPT
jgi:hypothetical protein